MIIIWKMFVLHQLIWLFYHNARSFQIVTFQVIEITPHDICKK